MENKDCLAYALKLIGDGPGLVSKFLVPENFVCVRMTDDKRPGVARFTKWNEAATFVPLESPTDDASLEQEEMLNQKWKASCVAPNPTMLVLIFARIVRPRKKIDFKL